jgi:methyl-accepting chemotaxis protein
MRTDTRSLHSFGLHLVLVTVASAAALLLVIGAVLLAPLVVQLEGGAASLDEMGRLAGRILELHATFWPVALALLAAVAPSSFVLYRRMTGPLRRFTGVFASIAEGVLPRPLTIRSSDYLVAEAAALNAMTSALREHREDVGRRRRELAEALGVLAEACAARTELEGPLHEVLEREKALAGELARLRLAE